MVLRAFMRKSQPTPAREVRLARDKRRSKWAELKYQPVKQDHGAFLKKKASKRCGFTKAYQALEIECAIFDEMLFARLRAALTQEAAAARMGTMKSAISRLETAGTYAPSLGP